MGRSGHPPVMPDLRFDELKEELSDSVESLPQSRVSESTFSRRLYLSILAGKESDLHVDGQRLARRIRGALESTRWHG